VRINREDPTQIIKTQRLLLCRPLNNDAVTLKHLWLDETVREFLGGTLTEAEADQKISALQHHWHQH